MDIQIDLKTAGLLRGISSEMEPEEPPEQLASRVSVIISKRFIIFRTKGKYLHNDTLERNWYARIAIVWMRPGAPTQICSVLL